MFKQLSIKGKMLSGFGIVILMSLCIAAIALYSMINSSKIGMQIRVMITQDVAPSSKYIVLTTLCTAGCTTYKSDQHQSSCALALPKWKS